MRSEWKEVRLKDICTKIGSGATPRGGKEAYKERGISLIRSQNVLDFAFTSEGLAFIDEMQAEKLENVSVQADDVLINITGDSVARVCKAPLQYLPARVNQHVSIIRGNFDKIESSFILYELQRQKAHLLSIASSGGTRNALRKSMLENLTFLLPSLSEQKAIATLLSCLDNKIELNKKINDNLEAQGQAIFKSWFVDFEPFQGGEFVESELGCIPTGWDMVALEDIANYVKERISVNKCNERNYISTENMLANKKGISFANSFPATTTVDRYENNDILISNIRPYFKKIWFADKIGGCSNDVLVIRAKNEIVNGYLYGLLYSDRFFEYMTSTSKGTKMPRGDKTAIMRYAVAFPTSFETNKYIKQFNLFVLLCQKKIQAMQSENQILGAIRDTLLPKLMNGEIEVPISNKEAVESCD